MFPTLLALIVLTALYGLYWLGACAFFFGYPHLKPCTRSPVYLGIALLALIPSLFILHFTTQLSALSHHALPGWIGLPAACALLAAPCIYTHHAIRCGKAPGLIKKARESHVSAPSWHRLLAALCLAAALTALSQMRLLSHTGYAEGAVVSRIPYYTYASRMGENRIRAEIAFTDGTGTRHSFTDASEYVPNAVGEHIGVYYDPAAPMSDPLPDLEGWERVDDLKLLLIALTLGWTGFRGLRPIATSRPHPAPKEPYRPLLESVKSALTVEVQRMGYECTGVFYAGAVHIDPRHLFFGVETVTDAQRDRMNADSRLKEALRRLLQEHGYPEKAIPEIGVRAESQETVDRVWDGDWFQAWR